MKSMKPFDTKVRQVKRQYKAGHRDYVTQLKAENPKLFWDEIHKFKKKT